MDIDPEKLSQELAQLMADFITSGMDAARPHEPDLPDTYEVGVSWRRFAPGSMAIWVTARITHGDVTAKDRVLVADQIVRNQLSNLDPFGSLATSLVLSFIERFKKRKAVA